MADKEILIDSILSLEWAMFQKVKGESPASCQQMPEKFKRIRGSLFGVWSQDALKSYLVDLETATSKEVNFLTQKYARMDNRIPPLKSDPEILKIINDIVAIETKWQKEIEIKYPALFNKMGRGTLPTGDGTNFSIYLACELETYSDKTIHLYYLNVMDADQNHVNLALKSLYSLLINQGFQSVNQAERYVSRVENQGVTE